MKEQFVSYKIAKILKKKGFIEACFGSYYDDNERLIQLSNNKGYSNFGDSSSVGFLAGVAGVAAAPLALPSERP